MTRSPQLLRTAAQARACMQRWRDKGLRIGLVPTMGALHQGHLSLLQRSRQTCDVTAVTIFVNPTQFGPGEDFERYPRQLQHDLDLLADARATAVFAPQAEAMYPPDHSTWVDPPAVARPLEGAFRPGHFRGVATIVLKLLQILPADDAFFGQKDFQQLRVIQDMVRDLNVPTRIIMCPTVREPDGLALSSRNAYLSQDQRARAVGVVRALQGACQLFQQGECDSGRLQHHMREVLEAHQIDAVDYAAVVDQQGLRPVELATDRCVALIAARVGNTRLIDNMFLAEGR